MLQMITWLDKNFSSLQPTRAIIMRALRHLRPADRKKLFSKDIPEMRTAEGRWFEAIIYEMILDLSLQTNLILSVVARGADGPARVRRAQLGQNGLFYSNIGDIKVRGNGQDLAEVDLMLVDHTGALTFGEIITSPADLKEFEEEIHYKKQLLGYLYGQPTVPFLLISSVDISRTAVVRRLLKEPDNILLTTASCEDLKTLIRPRDLKRSPPRKIRHEKLISISDIAPRRPFDYKQLHDERMQSIINSVTSDRGIEQLGTPDEIPPIVKKVLFGGLYPSAVRMLDSRYPIRIKGKTYDPDTIQKQFSKVVLAVNLPEYKPIIYLRRRNKKEYLKMVPNNRSGGFKFESRRTPHMAGFFLWLESVRPSLGAELTRELLDAFPAVHVPGATTATQKP
ncbi:hypothetical protein KH990_11080 [Methanoculleus bourgensis]|jgi:hypothetical protein|uniref:Uncharacterized protein n=1 Tax=Methanoculleus bourgensis TaxID=83986 RepID=A0A8T7H1R8_9EURY|nr:hypothetical protein [Methanoculleus bourgensis]MBT0733895.1 hypothetical protein [Methanoculleus bourgensis]NQS78381.1 hypothetical protein [Methanoculleus bourgensis]